MTKDLNTWINVGTVVADAFGGGVPSTVVRAFGAAFADFGVKGDTLPEMLENARSLRRKANEMRKAAQRRFLDRFGEDA